MNRILIISGSLRPFGNTYKGVQLVDEKVKDLGEVDFEYVLLKGISLEYCRGWGAGF